MIRDLVSRLLPKGSAVRNVATLMSGSVLGQLALVLTLPLLTRLYTPEEFGVLAVYASVLGIIGPIAGLRYEMAIPLPRTDGSALNVVVLTLICVGITTLLCSLAIIATGERIPEWLNTPAMAPYLWMVPLGLMLSGTYQALNYWAVRQKNFSRIARTNLRQGVVGAVTQVGMGLLAIGPLGLIIGHVVGKSAGLWILTKDAYRQDATLLLRVRSQRILCLARRHKKFPLFSTWGAMANSGSSMLPPIVLAAMFSPEIAGFYLLAQRGVQTPLTLIGASVGQVFHPKAVEARRQGTLSKLVFTSSKYLLRLSVIPLAVVGYFAPDAFAYLLGADWVVSGVYVRWLIPPILMQFFLSPISIIISVTENQMGGFLTQFLFLIFRTSFLIAGAYFGGSEGAIYYFSVSGVIVYTGLWLWILHIVQSSLLDWFNFMKLDIVVYLSVLSVGIYFLM